MLFYPVDERIKTILNDKLFELERHFNADFISFYGPLLNGSENYFLRIIEDLVKDERKKDVLYFMLTTGGGSAGTAERFVNIVRHHYKEINFIVPDYAYSAGTILCMSGDSILMDYFSVLGPIDPQVVNREGKLVPALGYLDKVNEFIEKAKKGTLTDAEFVVFKDMDLAELRSYEQAKELTISLLKKWLINYKFKNWDTHRTNPSLIGTPVTKEQKEKRAEEIADILSNNNEWKSHGRPINIDRLKELKLEIDDYSQNKERQYLIRDYYLLIMDYITKSNLKAFIHTRRYI